MRHWLILALLPLAFGCKEQEKKFRSWAQDQSRGFFEESLRLDSRSRYGRMWNALMEETPSELMTIVSDLQFETPRILKWRKLKEGEFRPFRQHTAEVLQRLLALQGRSEEVRARLLRLRSFCKEMPDADLPPPADIAGLVGSASGKRGFQFYLGVSISRSSGPDLQISPATGTEDGVSWLVHKIGDFLEDLFASPDEKTAWEDGERFLKANLPGLETRRKIASNECLDASESYKSLIEKLETRASQIASQVTGWIQEVGDGFAQRYFYLIREALLSADRDTARSAELLAALMDLTQSTRYLEDWMKALRSEYVDLSLGLVKQDCIENRGVQNVIEILRTGEILIQKIQRADLKKKYQEFSDYYRQKTRDLETKYPRCSL